MIKKTAELFDHLVTECKLRLEDQSKSSPSNQGLMAILYNLHNRITTWHPAEKHYGIEGLDVCTAEKMKARIEDCINRKRKQTLT